MVLALPMLLALLSIPLKPVSPERIDICLFLFFCELVLRSLSLATLLLHLESSLHVELVHLLVLDGLLDFLMFNIIVVPSLIVFFLRWVCAKIRLVSPHPALLGTLPHVLLLHLLFDLV